MGEFLYFLKTKLIALKEYVKKNPTRVTEVAVYIAAAILISVFGCMLLKEERAVETTILYPEHAYVAEPGSDVNEKLPLSINLNTASKEELMLLNGIGESRADKIIAYREKTPFKMAEELMNVSGIGEKLFEQVKDFIYAE